MGEVFNENDHLNSFDVVSYINVFREYFVFFHL